MADHVNESFNDTSSLDLPPDWVLIPLLAVKFLVLAVSFVGNLVIFLVICSSWKLRCGSMYIFIASLSLNNLVFTSTGGLIPAMAWSLKEPILDLDLCYLTPFFYGIFYCISLWHTAAIALDRLVDIVYRKHYERVPRIASILLVLTASRVFPLSFIFDVQRGAIAKTVLFNESVVCHFDSGFHLIFNFVLNVITPTTIVIASYAHIYVFLKKSHSRKSVLWKNRGPDRKAFRIFGMVSLTFLIGYLPLTVSTVVVTFTKMRQIWRIAFTTFAEIGIASHPFVYSFMDTDIRGSLVTIFCCRPAADEVRTEGTNSINPTGPLSNTEIRDGEQNGFDPFLPRRSTRTSRLQNMSFTDQRERFPSGVASHSHQKKQSKTVL